MLMTRLCVLQCIFLTASLGCDAQDESTDPEAVGVDGVIAELALSDGEYVRFIDEGEAGPGDGVGVMIVADPAVAEELIRHEPTALELFTALAPEREVPRVVREDHERLVETAGAASVPRILQLDLKDALKPSRSQSVTSFTCSTFFDHWCEDLASGWDDDCFENYGVGNTTTVAGTDSERWLGACNDSSSPALSWKVEAEISAGVWALVSGTSTTVNTGKLVVYSSSGFTVQNFRSVITTTASQAYYRGSAI